jgi:homoserine kinase
MKACISVPATIANLGSGFDTFGIAVDLRNDVEIESADYFSVIEEGIQITGKDLVLKAFIDTLKSYGIKEKFRIKKRTRIPSSKGLGSSAAAIVSGVALGMRVSGRSSMDELFQISSQMEGHPDNVAPAIFGGFTVSAKLSNGYVCQVMDPLCEEITVIIPPFSTSTEMARKILPSEIPLNDAVFNIQRAALLVATFKNGKKIDKELFNDRLHQNMRLSLHEELKDFFDTLSETSDLPLFVCGSGTAIGIIGHQKVDVKNGWQVMHLKTAKEGLLGQL